MAVISGRVFGCAEGRNEEGMSVLESASGLEFHIVPGRYSTSRCALRGSTKEWCQDEEALRQGEVQVHWQNRYESLPRHGRIVFGNGTAQIMQYEKVCELCARGEPQGVAQFHAISPP